MTWRHRNPRRKHGDKRLTNERRSLRNKSPKDWRRDIANIRDAATRFFVAGIIWWDWLGDCIAANRSKELDIYINQKAPEKDVPEKEIEKALVKCGYPPAMAANRVSGAYRGYYGKLK